MLIKRLLTSGVRTNIMPDILVFSILIVMRHRNLLLSASAQHFTLDIPTVPLHFHTSSQPEAHHTEAFTIALHGEIHKQYHNW